MNYRDLTNKQYGFIRSRTDLLSSEENYSSRRRHDYNPPEPYIPLDQRFYKYAGIEHPTITLDPQAYRRQDDYRYFHKVNRRNHEDESISSQQSSSELRSSQYSQDNNCYAHGQLPKIRNYDKHYSNEDSSSFELSPYQDDDEEQSFSDDSFSRQHDYRNSRRERRQKELMKSTLKGMKQVMEEESQDFDNSEQSQVRKLKKSNQHHIKSIDKIQKATKIMKQKIRTQKLEQQQKEIQHQNDQDQNQNQNSQFMQSARFNENVQHHKKQKIKTFQESDEDSPLKIEKKHTKQQFYNNKYQHDKEKQSFQKENIKQEKRIKRRSQQVERQQEKLISKHEGIEFHHSISNPILGKPQISKSQQKNKQQLQHQHNKSKKYQHQIQSRDQSVQVQQQLIKQNNPQNNQRKYKNLKQTHSYQKKPPVAFAIDNYRDDLTLAEAFKIHCSQLRHKLKQQRQQFKGHHEHQKKARKQKKRNASKTKTFVKNKLKKSTQYFDDAAQTRFSSPFTGKNNPLQQFKRMDIIRRRQLAKKYDKANRLRLLY